MVARVKALLRRVDRSQYSNEKKVSVGEVELDPATRQVKQSDQEVHLTATEFDLLYRLGSRPDFVFTREQILSDVWGYEDGFGTRTIDSHVAALRRKLGAEIIRTVHGVGYATGEAR